MGRKEEEAMITGAIGQSVLEVGPEIGVTILIKATIVLAAAGITTAMLRRASAAVRHAVWSMAAVMLILLPLLALVMPTSWPGRVVPLMEPRQPSFESLVLSTPELPAWLVASSEPAAGTGVGQGDVGPALPLSSTTIVALLAATWLAGCVIMIGRLGLHILRVNAMTRRGTPAADTEIRDITADAIKATGIRRSVQVIMSEDSSTPFSWGIRNPAIVLPTSAPGWPRKQKQSVLTHEVAHIARWDYPMHLAVEIAKALYWPNPLIWIASRCCAMERERACDDFALRGGTPRDLYAGHLIEIARAQVEAAPVSATTMAGEPGLVKRVHHVMNESLDRSRIRPAMLFLVICLALAVALPLGTVKVLSSDYWHIPSTEELIDDLLNDEDPTVRRRAAWWLGEHEDRDAVPHVIQALKDDNADVRQVAAWALGEIKDHDAVMPLMRNLEDDEDYLVREMAALALGEIENPKAVYPLMEAFDREEAMRAAIVWALGEIKGEEAEVARAIAFGKWGRDPWDNQEVWVGGYRDYEMGGLSLKPDVLIGQLRSDRSEERIRAAGSLGILGIVDGIDDIEAAVDALLEALRDPVPEVRALATWSLDEINPSRCIHRRQHGAVDKRINEHRMNALGYFLLNIRKYDEAIGIFKANVELFPESWNCYDSLGEAYMLAGNIELAIANYEKSLELDPHNENGKEKLKILRKLQ